LNNATIETKGESAEKTTVYPIVKGMVTIFVLFLENILTLSIPLPPASLLKSETKEKRNA
jgi:hypothetical protein